MAGEMRRQYHDVTSPWSDVVYCTFPGEPHHYYCYNIGRTSGDHRLAIKIIPCLHMTSTPLLQLPSSRFTYHMLGLHGRTQPPAECSLWTVISNFGKNVSKCTHTHTCAHDIDVSPKQTRLYYFMYPIHCWYVFLSYSKHGTYWLLLLAARFPPRRQGQEQSFDIIKNM